MEQTVTHENLLHLDDRDVVAFSKRQSWLNDARPAQVAPEHFSTWMVLAGRGFGKTRTGCEWAWWEAWTLPEPARVALVAPTNNDVRKTIIEGESGILACTPSELIKSYNRTSLELWLVDGSYFVGYSSEEPERLRGPQHHMALCDELAAWSDAENMWDMLQFGLRLGENPRALVATTPKPNPIVRAILEEPGTVVTTGSTYDNVANLPAHFVERIRKKYDGTRIGRQEIYAEILTQAQGALWQQEMLENSRWGTALPEFKRIVVAVDPAVSEKHNKNNEHGIVVVGVDDREHGYVLEDATTSGTPAHWAQTAISAYKRWEADTIVAEVNQGGDMVEHTIHSVDPRIPVKKVRASRGKRARAEPVAALYEKREIHHCGQFPDLEDQLVTWEPNSGMPSPDRLDALVWAVTDLLITEQEATRMFLKQRR